LEPEPVSRCGGDAKPSAAVAAKAGNGLCRTGPESGTLFSFVCGRYNRACRKQEIRNKMRERKTIISPRDKKGVENK